MALSCSRWSGRPTVAWLRDQPSLSPRVDHLVGVIASAIVTNRASIDVKEERRPRGPRGQATWPHDSATGECVSRRVDYQSAFKRVTDALPGGTSPRPQQSGSSPIRIASRQSRSEFCSSRQGPMEILLLTFRSFENVIEDNRSFNEPRHEMIASKRARNLARLHALVFRRRPPQCEAPLVIHCRHLKTCTFAVCAMKG